MAIFNFIGYFTLVLCDFALPGAMSPSSCSDFSGFISLLCHPYLPATFSGPRPRLFSSDPPPCYSCKKQCRTRLCMFPQFSQQWHLAKLQHKFTVLSLIQPRYGTFPLPQRSFVLPFTATPTVLSMTHLGL
jgi:hypothetical protein